MESIPRKVGESILYLSKEQLRAVDKFFLITCTAVQKMFKIN